MPRIHGTYEYDDDDLTPGNKKEGGLHQNLFDSEGNLKGSARFIPDDEAAEDESESVFIYHMVDVYDQEAERRLARQKAEEDAENFAIAAKFVLVLASEAAPHARRPEDI